MMEMVGDRIDYSCQAQKPIKKAGGGGMGGGDFLVLLSLFTEKIEKEG